MHNETGKKKGSTGLQIEKSRLAIPLPLRRTITKELTLILLEKGPGGRTWEVKKTSELLDKKGKRVNDRVIRGVKGMNLTRYPSRTNGKKRT